MRFHLANLFRVVALILVIIGICGLVFRPHTDTRGRLIVEQTRQSLRQQGFKTDLTDFDFSTSPELRAREAVLKAAGPGQWNGSFYDHPNLMELVGTNSVVVVWRQAWVKKPSRSWPDNDEQMTWDQFRDALNSNRTPIDAACAAILSGPIAFDLDAKGGNAMRLPHLALIKNLTQTLGSRTVLALHDADQAAAWTNLMAATRLVTAWQPEPVETSHLVRFVDTKLVFNATWQALQAGNWSDDRLAALQAEWESVQFLTNLPETAAFKRASNVAFCENDRHEAQESRPPFDDFVKEAMRSPWYVWSELQYRWSREEYFRRGCFEDERDLLLYYRNREDEMRQAVQTPTWARMRQLPGVVNVTPFQSKYRSTVSSVLGLHEMSLRLQRTGASFLGRAAQAEVERRILITALALERYHGKYGTYPKTLAVLAPEFLSSVPVDFMDGEPLRYRLNDDGHFLLYAIGQDCVDHGGKIQPQMGDENFVRPVRPGTRPPEADIVWPLPASMGDVTALRQREARAIELKNLSQEQRESEMEWEQSPLRQARVDKILTTKWSPDAGDMSDHGRPVSEAIRNDHVTGTNQLSLAELLTLKPVITGAEPGDLTYELPVSYDIITNRGDLVLLADSDPDDPEGNDGGARMQECTRAANGDCLLVWHTIYDPPGRHAVQAQLIWSNEKQGEFMCKGPAQSVVTSNLCQFSLASARFDPELGADWLARLPETNGNYVVELKTTDGSPLKTMTGSTSNGIIKVHWNLVDDHGVRFTNQFFDSVFHITLPESGRSQTLNGP